MPTESSVHVIGIDHYPDYIEWYHRIAVAGGGDAYHDGISPDTKVVMIKPRAYDATQFPRLDEVLSVTLVYKRRN